MTFEPFCVIVNRYRRRKDSERETEKEMNSRQYFQSIRRRRPVPRDPDRRERRWEGRCVVTGPGRRVCRHGSVNRKDLGSLE